MVMMLKEKPAVNGVQAGASGRMSFHSLPLCSTFLSQFASFSVWVELHLRGVFTKLTASTIEMFLFL